MEQEVGQSSSNPTHLKKAYSAFMSEFMAETDRASIVLASAEIEFRLEKILRRFLDIKKENHQAFDFNGPLGSLSNMIIMVYQLRIINKEFYHTLQLIRKIRNQVVHEGMKLEIFEGAVLDRIKTLVNPFLESDKFKTWMSEEEEIEDIESQFRWVISFVIVMLDHTYWFLEPLELEPHAIDPEMYID